MLQMEALKQVLEQRGIDFQEVMEALKQEQQVVSFLRAVGQGAANLVGESGWLALEVIVTEDKVTVGITAGTLRARTLEMDRKPSQKESGQSSQSGSREGRGSQVVALLESACGRYGLSLKDWQRRSIAFHAPQVFKALVKETKGAILQDPDFKEAVRAYADWHPERSQELPL